jgi:hypothetical protein
MISTFVFSRVTPLVIILVISFLLGTLTKKVDLRILMF